MTEFAYRPITTWPRKPTELPRSSPFKVNWRQTLIDLELEVRQLGGRGFTIGLFVEEDDIRIDGQLRAGSAPRRPGVIVSFDSRHGRMTYPCDRFTDWRHNVRAISLTLNALRTMNRYGVTGDGEQYTAWKALPAPSRGPADDIRDPPACDAVPEKTAGQGLDRRRHARAGHPLGRVPNASRPRRPAGRF